MKHNVIHLGPAIQGVGGIETVIRTYVGTEWTGLASESLATWNKTSQGRKQRTLALHAAAELIRRRRSGRDLPIIHVHLSHKGSFLREGALLILARKMGFCVVATIHGSAFVSSELSRRWGALYRWVLRRAHAVGVLNEVALATVAKMRLPVGPLLVQNPGPFGATGQESHSPGSCEPVAVFAGTVGRRKGVDTLLAAWPLVLRVVPEATLEVWGPVEDEMLNSTGAVYFKGPTSAMEVSERLLECRVAVLPSTAEAMPMFILEAMGAGRPSVVTDVGAMPSQIGGGGTVVAVGDAGQLAEALIKYLADPLLADQDGSAARKSYETKFNPRQTEKGLQAFYEVALKSMKVSGV